MSRFKVRISTLMLLIVIVALAVGMVVQTMRYERLLTERQEQALLAEKSAKRAAIRVAAQVRFLESNLLPQTAPNAPDKPTAK